ncbi:aquaporin-like protein [Cenococcum geophilum]
MPKPSLPFHNHSSSTRHGWAVKNHFVAASGEFVGTFLFLYFGFAAHSMAVEQTDAVALANGQKSAQMVVYIVLGYGFSLLVTVWAFYRISGGLFNPAVSVLLFFFALLCLLRYFASCPRRGGKSKDTFLASVGIGLALFVAELAGDGGSLNPARSFGPSVAGTWFPGYRWIYWANPGQDSATNDFVVD